MIAPPLNVGCSERRWQNATIRSLAQWAIKQYYAAGVPESQALPQTPTHPQNGTKN
jgi:hypothetical protein